MIQRFRPVWNQVLDGFGNHDPGKDRYNGILSQWDTLHHGRPWAPRVKKPNPKSADELAKDVIDYLAELEA